MLLLTLLFLGVVGLHRTWDLRSYTGEGLALLTGRKRAYSYRYTEDFLTYLACIDAGQRLTDALARFTKHLWSPEEEIPVQPEAPSTLMVIASLSTLTS